jgi:hypothetical protein
MVQIERPNAAVDRGDICCLTIQLIPSGHRRGGQRVSTAGRRQLAAGVIRERGVDVLVGQSLVLRPRYLKCHAIVDRRWASADDSTDCIANEVGGGPAGRRGRQRALRRHLGSSPRERADRARRRADAAATYINPIVLKRCQRRRRRWNWWNRSMTTGCRD